MTLNEYQTAAARTIATDDTVDMQKHALFGLTAEIGELMDAYYKTDIVLEHVIKECGDVCWMCAELCTARGWFLGDIVSEYTGTPWGGWSVSEAAMCNGRIHGTYQKVLQGHSWDADCVKENINKIFSCMCGVAGCCGSSLDEVLQMNIEKLKARYPDGFSTDRSLHRADGDV